MRCGAVSRKEGSTYLVFRQGDITIIVPATPRHLAPVPISPARFQQADRNSPKDEQCEETANDGAGRGALGRAR